MVINTNQHKKNIYQLKILVIVLTFIFLLIIAFWVSIDISEVMNRSTSLQRKISNGDGYERIDYVDKNGSIAYAADKHHATMIIRKEDNTVLEEFYGTDGQPTKQNLGYYYIKRLYDKNGREYETLYLDLDKKRVMTRAGYASVKRIFDDKKNIVTEKYYDEYEKPVETSMQGYGCTYEYNGEGRNTKTIYLGLEGKPHITRQGFAIIYKKYFEDGKNKGKVKEEYYFDEKEKPIKLKDGYYGLQKNYDDVGRINTYTYLDADGNPTITNKGYTTIVRSYYNDDSVERELYYDKVGKPVALDKGQYGVLRKEGRSILLDENGRDIKSFHNLLYGAKWFSILACFIIVLVSSFLSAKSNVILIILYSFFILYVTIINRSNSSNGVILIPFWSYRQFFINEELAIEIFNNILLFIPFASILYNVYSTKRLLLVVLLFSILIEFCQFLLGAGLCEIDDVISNLLGGHIGYLLGKSIKDIRQLKGYKMK